jgi:hydroxymethylglutaryl-CoA synthase
MENIGIISYGANIPRFRIKVEEIASVWGKDGKVISRGLGVQEKSVPGLDQDTATISVESARAALRRCNIDPQDIGAIYVGSESHPYAVKPTGTIVGEAIGATPDLMVADYEFACKAGTAGIQTCIGLELKGNILHMVDVLQVHQLTLNISQTVQQDLWKKCKPNQKTMIMLFSINQMGNFL